jgi:hypothetical protein
MDSLINAAALALAAGDPLRALNHVALRDDAPALALRGIAMAQLGDLGRAKVLLRAATRAFGIRHAMARARCVVAEAEIALAARDLVWTHKTLDATAATLERHGDKANAAHARLVAIRRLLLIGDLEDAERRLEDFDPRPLTPALAAGHGLIVAGIAMRRLHTAKARVALARARRAAHRTGITTLMAEVESASVLLDAPVARLTERGNAQMLRLAQVESLLASNRLVIDACRNVVRRGGRIVTLSSRPVLFALARALGEAWPGDVSRQMLLARAFGARHADESHRARLRVEIGRLRRLLRPLADVRASKEGFQLMPKGSPAFLKKSPVAVLAPPVEEDHSGVLALLADGEAWSSSALGLALGASQRSVQRSLTALAAAGKVHHVGHGRSRRWMMPPLPGFATGLLLPFPLPGG